MFSKFIVPFFAFLAPPYWGSFPMEWILFPALFAAASPEVLSPVKVENSQERSFEEAIRTMSFNIRSDDESEHHWEGRKDRVISVIRFHHPDLIGLQEPTCEQIEDLKKAFPEFSVFTGSCLQDGRGGLHDPILYRKSRFELLDSGFFFLSQTPYAPGIGWDAKFPRGTAWVYLKDKKTQETFYFFNTHFDYHGKFARDQSAHLLREKVFMIANEERFIVVGDFNLFPKLGGEETYRILTLPGPFSEGRPFIDAQKISVLPHHGPTGTWSGFKEAGQPGIKPDYIFVDEKIEVLLHGVLADTFDGKFPSDHLPVLADLRVR